MNVAASVVTRNHHCEVSHAINSTPVGRGRPQFSFHGELETSRKGGEIQQENNVVLHIHLTLAKHALFTEATKECAGTLENDAKESIVQNPRIVFMIVL